MALSASGTQSNILLDVGTNELELIEFVVGGQIFGINVAKVKQVVQWNPEMRTAMPDAPEAVLGVLYHRGKPVTLIDLRKALEIEAPACEPSRQLVLITEFNDLVTSFLIDKVERIHRLSWTQLKPFKEFLPGMASYIIGCVHIQERLLMVLDLEHLMSVLVPRTGINSSLECMQSVVPNRRRADVTVMYAEDSGMIRRMTSGQLKAAGFTKILAYENGLRAFEKIKEFHAESLKSGQPLTQFFNILLTDIEMPEMDGLTLCKSLKKDLQQPDFPVVIYSSLINDQMALKCQAVGSNAHISKPRIDQIVSVLDEQCGISEISPH